MSRFVEIRSYHLRRGAGPAFHALVSEDNVPLLRKWKIDVIAAGPSLHDQDSYFLIRGYDSLAPPTQSRRVLGKRKQGPRAAIIALIESDTSVVVELSEASVAALREGFAAGPV